MKVICMYEKLKEAVESCERIISRQLALPILNNLHLKAEKGTLTISSTNLELGIVVTFACKIAEEGEIKGQSAAEYPIIPRSKEPALLVVEADTFAGALSRVVGFTALSETRP